VVRARFSANRRIGRQVHCRLIFYSKSLGEWKRFCNFVEKLNDNKIMQQEVTEINIQANETNARIRELLHTSEFDEFLNGLDQRTRDKFGECFTILETMYVLSTKFVKKLVGTDLYELRVSVGHNEYRTVLLAVDHENIIQATKIILLNGFLKKSTKDYDKQIKKAINLLNTLSL
jgi:mRNA-degrading endonuclease RelE of RelBE toxin-antitoxin system